MFSRNSDRDPTQPPAPPTPGPARPAAISNGTTTTTTTGPSSSGPVGMTSVIGSDLTIIGSGLRIIAQKTLQVDGEVQGDVLGSRVVIGPGGKVTGLVNAEQVHINGAVHGTIKGVDVVLSASAVVEGDIFHHSIKLEQGACFEGRSRRPKDRAELLPNLAGAEQPGLAPPDPSQQGANPNGQG